MNHKTPLERRLAKHAKYWTDPNYRLLNTNQRRRERGQPEYVSADQIPPRSEIASSIPRGARGRFTKAI